MVRIILDSGRKKGAIASLAVAIVAAASVWAGFWVWHHEERIVPVQRRLEDGVVRWRCPNHHVFEAQGAYGAIPCPTCTQPSRVLIGYQCPEHGRFDLRVMFDESTGKPENVRSDDGPWFQVSKVIPCPKCGRKMHSRRRNPFAALESARAKKAGGLSANLPP